MWKNSLDVRPKDSCDIERLRRLDLWKNLYTKRPYKLRMEAKIPLVRLLELINGHITKQNPKTRRSNLLTAMVQRKFACHWRPNLISPAKQYHNRDWYFIPRSGGEFKKKSDENGYDANS